MKGRAEDGWYEYVTDSNCGNASLQNEGSMTDFQVPKTSFLETVLVYCLHSISQSYLINDISSNGGWGNNCPHKRNRTSHCGNNKFPVQVSCVQYTDKCTDIYLYCFYRLRLSFLLIIKWKRQENSCLPSWCAVWFFECKAYLPKPVNVLRLPHTWNRKTHC